MGRKSLYQESCNGSHFDSNDCNDFVHNLHKRVRKAEEAGQPIPMDAWASLRWHIASIITSNCPMCDTRMERNYGGKHQKNNSPECDRIDPNLGYVAGNVQIICHACNVAKDGRTMKQFWSTVARNMTHLPKEFVNQILVEAGEMSQAQADKAKATMAYWIKPETD